MRFFVMFAIVLANSVFAVQAKGLYGVVTGGIVTIETGNMDENSGTYKLGMGYQFSKKWYVEGGFQLLAEKNFESFSRFEETPAIEASALFISLLGKATGRSGELFYRLGILRADVKEQYLLVEQCLNNEHQVINNPSTQASYCLSDNGIFAANIGLGYDYYVTPTALVRFEIEHIQGEDDFNMQAITLGVRYNF